MFTSDYKCLQTVTNGFMALSRKLGASGGPTVDKRATDYK
jgi:hypothetical protein